MTQETELKPAYAERIGKQIEQLLKQSCLRPLIIGIDGRCASGKTTLAHSLHERYGWDVVHADDFFLRPQQRTPERYAEPGGNLDRERLIEEVLMPLRQNRPVVFQRFDCSIMKLNEQITLKPTDAVIVEGSYALHPSLREYYDLKIFMDAEYEEQLRRIEHRSGKAKLEQFKTRWIPLEETYFESCGVKECADICINSSFPEGF